MGNSSDSIRRTLPIVVAMLLFATILSAQSTGLMIADSATWEARLSSYPQATIEDRARAYLRGRIEREDAEGVEPLLEFMRVRMYGSRWTSDEEELLLLLYLGRADALLDTSNVDRILYAMSVGSPPDYPSPIAIRPLLQSSIQRDIGGVIGALVDRMMSDDDAMFLQLLVNGATVRGVRTVDDYNGMIDRFIDEFDGSRWRDRARRLYKVAVPESIGLGLHLTYQLVQPLSASPINRHHGPSLAGALSIDRFRFDVALLIHAVEFSGTTMVGGEVWESGVGSTYGIASSIGYDIPFGRGWLGLFVGGRLTELEGASSETNDDPPTTGLRAAPFVGARTGWRIPFDRPPHIDLKLFATLGRSNLPSGYEAFDTTILTIGLGFGLIQRPYRVIFDRSR